MHLAKKPVARSIAVPLLLLSVVACSAPSTKVVPVPSSAEFAASDFEKPVARVNGSAISAADLKRAQKILLANKPGLQIPPMLQKEFETQALNQLITNELLFQASQKLEIKDLDQQAQEKLALIRQRYPDPKVFDQELQKIGMDEKSFLDSSRRELAVTYLVNTTIAPKISVTDEEIKKFYQENPDKFRVAEQVRASHILIGVDAKAGAEEKKAAREKAEKLHRELVQDADFAKLARENSTCPSSKQGGDLGYFSRGRMVPPFEHAAFSLQPGGVSDVVQTEFGYHIIKLSDRKKPEQVSLDSAKTKIAEYLRVQKTNAAIEAFVAAARKEAKVEVLLPGPVGAK